MRVTILVAVLAVACDSGKPKREISKQMNISNGSGKTESCVEGDEPTCVRAGGRWIMELCCLPKASCDLGDATACGRLKGAWTGKYCCLATPADDEASCATLGGTWTNMRCIVK